MGESYFFIRANRQYYKILISDIIYAESCGNYIKMVTTTQTYLVYSTMQATVALLPAQLFCRIHRSFLVAIERIESFNNTTLMIRNGKDALITLPMGHSGYYSGLIEKLTMLGHRESSRKQKHMMAV